MNHPVKALFGLFLFASACGADPDAAAEPTDLAEALVSGKADGGIGAEFELRDGEVRLHGAAAAELYAVLEAAGGFAAHRAGAYDYLLGAEIACVTDGSASACALAADGSTVDEGLDFVIDGPRFDSAASEIFGALARARGQSPALVAAVDSRLFVCSKSSHEVWCGLRSRQRLTVQIENVASFTHAKSGSFAIAQGADAPGPLAPGDAYEISFTAGRNHRLSFATMLGQSNDWFFAPAAEGIALFDGDTPISGDITDRVFLWDSGTEVDEEPGVGPHTGPNQASSTDGPGADDPDPTVRLVPNPVVLTDGTPFELPRVDEMIRVTLESDPQTRMFTLRIENVATDDGTLFTSEGPKPVRVSPGVWTLAAGDEPLFSVGEVDRGQGLEAIAEAGQVADLAGALSRMSGVATGMSPGVFVVHGSQEPLFTLGQPDRGLGLGDIAETGNVAALVDAFSADLPRGASGFEAFDTPVGAAGPGPIRPGDAYAFVVDVVPGDRLSFATMFGASNDWIFATRPDGIELFDGSELVLGDVTDAVGLYDVGVELDEEPGVGPNIGGPQGPADPDENVRRVGPEVYPTSVDQHLRVTLSR